MRYQAIRSVGRVIRLGTGLLLASALGGCQSHDMAGQNETSQQVKEFIQVQAAAGAKSDAMLYPAHFEGADLNGLGKEKLDLMVQARAADRPAVVYLNLPGADAQAADRRAAVEKYLVAAGLQQNQIELKTGPNPEAMTPAAMGMSQLAKMQTEGSASTGAAGSTSMQSGSSGFMSSSPSGK